MSGHGWRLLIVLKEKLSPHLDTASSMLALFPAFKRKGIEMEPEERLAIYLRLREMRRKMGLSGDCLSAEGAEHGVDGCEGAAFGGDADNDCGGPCGCCNSGDTAYRSRAGGGEKCGGEFGKDKPDDGGGG